MSETTQELVAYVQSNPVLYLGMAFVAGFAGTKSVSSEGKSGIILYLLVGMIGFFLGQFVIIFFGLKYIDKIPEFRVLFDFIAAYIGSFVVATLIHFVKPL